jgi:hypothetical protein
MGVDHPSYCGLGKDNGKMVRCPRIDVAQIPQFQIQYSAIEEQSAKGLILGGFGDPYADGKLVEGDFHLAGAHLRGVALIIEKYESSDPIPVGFFGPNGRMLSAQGIPELIQYFYRVRFRDTWFVLPGMEIYNGRMGIKRECE